MAALLLTPISRAYGTRLVGRLYSGGYWLRNHELYV